jgi:predicted choloylglycine hydrolase
MLASDLGLLLHWTLELCHLGESSQNQLGWIPNALNIDMIVLDLKAGVAVSERLAHRSLMARRIRTRYICISGRSHFNVTPYASAM